MMHKHRFEDATGKIIGCCIEVHRRLGPGFREIIYQRALAMELEAADLGFEREVWIPVVYRGREVGKQRVDFVIEGTMVEIKALSEMQPVKLCAGSIVSESQRMQSGPAG